MSFVAVSSAKPILPAFGWIEDALSPFAEPVLRLATGLILMPHGAQKLFGWFGGYGLAGTAGFFEQLGFRPGRAFAAAAGASEFGGGLLVALGLLGPVGPALVVSVMIVAAGSWLLIDPTHTVEPAEPAGSDGAEVVPETI